MFAASRLGYRPNPHARALARSRDSTIGVVVHDVSDPYFSQIVHGMLSTAGVDERMLLICDTATDPVRELACIAHFRAVRAHALILAGSGLEDPDFEERMSSEVAEFAAGGGRVALIGRHHTSGDTVIPDNVGGARGLARLLVGLGHRRIGIISGPAYLTTTHDRLAGFRLGLEEAGVGWSAVRMVPGDFTREGGAIGVRQLLRSDSRLTAVWALNDVMAVGALVALRDDGIEVPDELTVCGFDDVPAARDVWPRLTTVRVPMAEMGARALQLALEHTWADLRVDQLETELIVRESSGPPRHHRAIQARRAFAIDTAEHGEH